MNAEQEWLRNNIPLNNKYRTILFTASFRDFFAEWHESDRGKYKSYKEATQFAKEWSVKWYSSLIKVHCGDLVISLWANGENIFIDEELDSLFTSLEE